MKTVDWDRLREEALDATNRSYAPYSRFSVGAAALTDTGRIVTGCNVENASYGLSLCAECGLVSNLFNTGGGRLVALSCRHADGSTLMPCGRCRQLLYEVGGKDLLVDAQPEARRLGELLPESFGPDDLAARGADGS
ncbi:MAG: cytidine deaminase [Actinomycetota bacterium]